ncbi:PH domain-containing protein [Asticcacaulis solisilvae]|uniref:PH domain-containing protein n=1 Tax=Asticcacaulis solisilvae TaxID=1217274 RepID=UPI003FD7FDC0
MTTEVRIQAGGFILREGWWRHKTVKWSSVVAIHARRVDRVTYDEIFLMLELADGRSVSIGELDKGFAAFREALPDTFPNMETNWYSLAERHDGKPVRVWHADQHNPPIPRA